MNAPPKPYERFLQSLPTYSALPVFSASFYEFGSAWVWGALGGLLGRGYVRRRGARLEVRG